MRRGKSIGDNGTNRFIIINPTNQRFYRLFQDFAVKLGGIWEARLCEPQHVRISGRGDLFRNWFWLAKLLRVADPRSGAAVDDASLL